ncbi:MAG: Lrp/AsnC family transcriptional regulator [Thermoplasmata archaeon]|nr:MAG: Lrp/AsnC family transcriptional regulator [Thermoplasmata archaeon]
MRIRKKSLFYLLAILSSLIAAGVTSIDTYISIKYKINPWTLCLAIFIAGMIITLLLCIFLSIPIGKKAIGTRIDPSFYRIRLLRKEELPYHILAGIGNAVATIAYFFIISIYKDPSATISFFQVVILYLLLTESIAEKNAPTLAEVESSVIVTFGAIMASFSLQGEINFLGLLIVFAILNPAWVLFSIYQRRLKLMKINGRHNDAINIRFWNLLFTTLFTSLLVYFIDAKRFFEVAVVMKYWQIFFLSMGVTFFSYILYIRALGLGKASVTQAVKSSTIIFSIPFSILLSKFVHISLYESPQQLVIKTMGIILVVMGVISFALTEVKAYIFMKASTGYSIDELMRKIWKIKGITSVATVAGKYDIIAKARIRTLGKGYERIIRELEGIKGIERFEWQSILKEWEEV